MNRRGFMKLTGLAAIFPCLPKVKAKKKVGWTCNTKVRVLNNADFKKEYRFVGIDYAKNGNETITIQLLGIDKQGVCHKIDQTTILANSDQFVQLDKYLVRWDGVLCLFNPKEINHINTW